MARSGPKRIPAETWGKVRAILEEDITRKKRHTQEGLAEALGVKGSSVSAWFNGGSQAALQTAISLLRFLGHSPREVLGDIYPPEAWEEHAIKEGLDPSSPHVRAIYESMLKMAMDRAAKAIREAQSDESGERPSGRIRTS